MNDLISRQDAIRLAEQGQIQGFVWQFKKLCTLPSAEPKIIHCKDCRNRGEDECPMRHVERIEWEEDGYIEVDDIVHDYTEPYGYCYKGERNE